MKIFSLSWRSRLGSWLGLSLLVHGIVLAIGNSAIMTLPGHPDYTLSVTLGDQFFNRPATPEPQEDRLLDVPRPEKSSIVEAVPLPSQAKSEPPASEDRNTDNGVDGLGEGSVSTQAFIRSRLLDKLGKHFQYPSLARIRGWEGTVLLGLRVEPDGHLERIRIERSSGYAVLDRSALNSLGQVGPLTEVSVWLNGQGMDMQLPVIYRLIEN